MHYITNVEYDSGFKLYLQFEDGSWRSADLERHLDGEIFEPLKNPARFSSARLNPDIDTVVWDNGADMSPDFLYEISSPVSDLSVMQAAEESVPYRTRSDEQ
jgi:hypothetical protein